MESWTTWGEAKRRCGHRLTQGEAVVMQEKEGKNHWENSRSEAEYSSRINPFDYIEWGTIEGKKGMNEYTTKVKHGIEKPTNLETETSQETLQKNQEECERRGYIKRQAPTGSTKSHSQEESRKKRS